MQETKSIFEALDPKQTFFAGLITGFLVVCTIGFFILLSMIMSNGTYVLNDGTAVAKAPAAEEAKPANPSDSGNAPAAPTGASGADAVTPVDEDADHIRGDRDAAITIVEYSDMECPFCSRFHDTMKQVLDKYDGQVRWVYRHFPLTSIHPNATGAAIAAECAGDQDKFWEFTDEAFARQSGGLNSAGLETIAKSVGLKMSDYNDCVSSAKYQSKVASDARNAQATGGRGTPHSVIIGPNDEKVVLSGAQPLSGVEQALQQFLEK